jgi:hypothetical protein
MTASSGAKKWTLLRVAVTVVGLFALSIVGTFVFYACARLKHDADLAANQPTGPAEWTRYVSSSGDYVALFPFPPVESDETTQRDGGEVRLRGVATGTAPGEGYTVMAAEDPSADPNAPAAATLDRLVAELVARSKGKLVSQKDVTSGGVAGRELRVDTTESSLRVRLFAANHRIYQVLAVRKPSIAEDGLDARFLESFTLRPTSP